MIAVASMISNPSLGHWPGPEVWSSFMSDIRQGPGAAPVSDVGGTRDSPCGTPPGTLRRHPPDKTVPTRVWSGSPASRSAFLRSPDGDQTVSMRRSQPVGGRIETPVLLGHVGVQALVEHVITFEGRDLALVVVDGGAFAVHVGLDGHDRRCRPQPALNSLATRHARMPGMCL